MKRSLLIIFLFVGLLMSAKGIKINHKTEIKPYTIKIEKVENLNGKTLVYGKIKQQKRFSYNVDFDDCWIETASNPDGIAGSLVMWNDDKKIPFTNKSISDQKEESFVLEFPEGAIPAIGSFNLKIGTAQNKNKTELIIRNISLNKK